MLKHDNGKWIHFENKIEILLVKKGTPVIMYSKNTLADNKSKIEINNVEIGYDLMIGDWVNPHGEGKTSDFFVKFEHDIKSENDYLHTMTLRFPNDGDGLIYSPVPLREQNELVLSKFAPETGYSKSYVEQEGSKNGISICTAEEGDNFYIRTRTVIKEGKIVSAYYGKIIGRLEGSNSNFLCMKYFLNPNPNDRNLEVDRSDNLLKKLTRSQSPVSYKNYEDYAK